MANKKWPLVEQFYTHMQKFSDVIIDIAFNHQQQSSFNLEFSRLDLTEK